MASISIFPYIEGLAKITTAGVPKSFLYNLPVSSDPIFVVKSLYNSVLNFDLIHRNCALVCIQFGKDVAILQEKSCDNKSSQSNSFVADYRDELLGLYYIIIKLIFNNLMGNIKECINDFCGLYNDAWLEDILTDNKDKKLALGEVALCTLGNIRNLFDDDNLEINIKAKNLFQMIFFAKIINFLHKFNTLFSQKFHKQFESIRNTIFSYIILCRSKVSDFKLLSVIDQSLSKDNIWNTDDLKKNLNDQQNEISQKCDFCSEDYLIDEYMHQVCKNGHKLGCFLHKLYE